MPWITSTPGPSNILFEFPILIWYAEAAKVPKLNYHVDNDDLGERFIIPAKENTQIGRPGKKKALIIINDENYYISV